jgi:hypothetical protein
LTDHFVICIAEHKHHSLPSDDAFHLKPLGGDASYAAREISDSFFKYALLDSAATRLGVGHVTQLCGGKKYN